MLPIIIGAGIFLLYKGFFEKDKKKSRTRSRKEKKTKRLFISFAYEDRKYRDFLVQQAKDERSPFSFEDMSVKEPWNNNIWKRKCRMKICNCEGLIVLLSKNTWHSSGSRWEIKCAIEEGVKVIGMHIKKNDKGAIPPELDGKQVIEWNWNNLKKFINKI